jgi:hypothetical protein
MAAKINLSQRTISLIWGIPLTATLMAGAIMALLYAFIRNEIVIPGPDELWLSSLTFAGTAVGGAAGVRIIHLSWRQVIVSALLAGIGLIVSARFIPSAFLLSPWDTEAIGMDTFGFVLFFLFVIAAGSFLLPLFDPAVRKSGPAPSVWKVILTALLLSLLMAWSHVVDFYSIVGVIFVGILPTLGVMIGLIFSLTNRMLLGAWLGGVIVLLPPLLLAIWLIGLHF